MYAKYLYLSSLVVVAAARAAHANPVADFKTGTSVILENGTVEVGNGPRTSTGSSAISKASGSLDFALRASDLGISLPLTIHLQGTLLTTGLIDYAINDVYSPSVDLGGGHYVVAVTGHVTMRAVRLRGSETPKVGNVRLVIAAASSVVVRTDLGNFSIAIDELTLQGGVTQPTLAGVRAPTHTICSDSVATKQVFSVSLTGPAEATGVAVELTTSRDAGVHFPRAVVVRAGRQSATVTARIEPNFVGRARLTAAAGGATRAIAVDVRPPGDCSGH